jgi:hypothetical protein
MALQVASIRAEFRADATAVFAIFMIFSKHLLALVIC